MTSCPRVLIAALFAGLGLFPGLALGQEDPVHNGKPLSHWIKQLENRDFDQRIAAAQALGEMGPKAKAAEAALIKVLREDKAAKVPALGALVAILPGDRAVALLVSALKGKEGPAARESAFAMMPYLNRRNGAQERVPALIEALKDKDAEVRIAVVKSLGFHHLAAKPAVPAMIELLKDPNTAVRQAAIDALGQLKPVSVEPAPGAEAVPALGVVLHDRSAPSLHQSAFQALCNLGPPAVPVLLKALRHDDPGMREKVAEVLSKFDFTYHATLWNYVDSSKKVLPGMIAAVPDVVAALKDDNARVRIQAATILGHMGHHSKETGAALIAALSDKDDQVKNRAAHSLTRLGPATAPALAVALRHKDGAIRLHAATALAAMQPPPVESFAPLMDAFKDNTNSAEVRTLIAGVLVEIGPRAKWSADVAMPVLIEAIKVQGDWKSVAAVQRGSKAAMILKEFAAQSAPAAPVLIEAIKKHADNRMLYVNHLADALGAIGPEAKAALPTLRQLILSGRLEHGSWACVFAVSRMGEEGIPILLEALAEKGPIGPNQPAAEALARLGPPLRKLALPGVIKALQDDKTCGNAAYVLSHYGPLAREAVPALIDAVKNKKQESRHWACEALGAMGADAKPAIAFLIGALRTDLRPQAVMVLGKIGPEAKEAVPVILDTLDKDMQNQTALALVRIGSVPDLLKGINHKSDHVRSVAVAALGLIGPSAAPALAEAITSKDANVQEKAMIALRKMGPKASAAVPRLIEALKDKQPTVANVAAFVLEGMGEKAKEAVPALCTTLQHDDPQARRWAAAALGHFPTEAKQLVPLLAGALKDKEAAVRRAAATSLGQMGPAAKDALPALEQAAQEQDGGVRNAALEAMRQVRDEPDAELAGLIKTLRSEDKLARRKAALALGKRKPAAKQAVSALIETLGDKELVVRSAAVLALGQIGPQARAAIPRLLEMRQDPKENVGVKRIVESALKKIGPGE